MGVDQFVQHDVRLLVLGDLNPALSTHQEAQATLECLPRGVEHDLLATDVDHARELECADCVWVLPGSRIPSGTFRSLGPAAAFTTRA